ncbi:MAG: type I-E CRISPR-associated protein Cas7/Cse4/CasC, partial [Rubricoccaceae bacterium]
FGGTERGRISSQAIKRAVRKSPFVAERLRDKISTRSLHIPQMLFDEMRGQFGGDEDRLRALCEAVTHALGKPDKENPLKTSQIVFLTPDEIARLRGLIADKMADGTRLTGKAVKEFGDTIAKATGLDTRPTDAVDMALFGRMTTDEAASFAAVDAAMQVAHPIATHTTVTETDYFTAVDDWKAAGGSGGETDTRGSGHIGEIDFNSAVYYGYVSCDLDALARNLGGDTDAALEGLAAVLEAFCRVTPSGKQNSFASHAPAETVLLVLREARTPCSLAGAFEAAVPASEQGYVAESTRRMLARYARLRQAYDLEDRAIAFTVSGQVPASEAYDVADRLADVWAFLRRHAAFAPAGNGAMRSTGHGG